MLHKTGPLYLFAFCWTLLLDISLGQQALGQNPMELVDSKNALVVEIANLEDFIELSLGTDLFSNERWNDIEGLVIHEKFGKFDEETYQTFRTKIDDLLSDFRPGNSLFCVADDLSSWQMILNLEPAEDSLESNEILNRIQKLFQIWNGNSSEKESGDPGFVAVKVGEDEILNRGNLFIFEKSNLLVATNSQKLAKTTSQRIDQKNEFRSLADSRKYKRVKATLSPGKQERDSQIDIHFDPTFAIKAIAGVDDRDIRTWGFNEFLAAGISVDLIRSKIDRERVEIILNGVVLVAEPRVGIAKAVELKGTPAEFPPIPSKVNALWYANLDWKKLGLEQESLFDSAYGDGSFQKARENGNKLRELMGSELRRKNLDLGKFVQGGCFFKAENSIEMMQFREINDVEAQIEVLEKRTVLGAQTYTNYGFVRETIAGVPGMVTKQSQSSNNRMAIAFWDTWMLASRENALTKLIENGVGGRCPEEIELLIERLLNHSTIKDDRSIVLAIFPEGWDLLGNTYIARSLSAKIFKLAREKFPGDTDAAKQEYRRLTQDWGKHLENLDPESKEEWNNAIQLTLVKIFVESFGHFIMLGNDSGNGLRFSAMTSPVELPASSDSDE